MTGETNLEVLLGSMSPRLVPGVFVFASLPALPDLPEGRGAVMILREPEGWTLILREEDALVAAIEATFRCRMITLTVHSALAAVGFLAAIIPALAAAGMGVNPVSGYVHDHLFVPAGREVEAMTILERLAAGHGRRGGT